MAPISAVGGPLVGPPVRGAALAAPCSKNSDPAARSPSTGFTKVSSPVIFMTPAKGSRKKPPTEGTLSREAPAPLGDSSSHLRVKIPLEGEVGDPSIGGPGAPAVLVGRWFQTLPH